MRRTFPRVAPNTALLCRKTIFVFMGNNVTLSFLRALVNNNALSVLTERALFSRLQIFLTESLPVVSRKW